MSVIESTEGDHGDNVSIYDAYLSCLRSFASLKDCSHLSQASQRLVEDEQSRFDIWATNIGACLNLSVSLSLDHRLRNSDNTQEIVVLLLRVLRVNLDYARRIFDQPDETLHDTALSGNQYDNERLESSTEGHPPTAKEIATALSSEALQSVHRLISQLKKLSTAIRRAMVMEYSVHAAKERDTKDNIDQGADDELLARKIVDYRFRDAPESLREILSTGISFRMRRFRDWKRHYERRQKRAKIAIHEQAIATEQHPPAVREPKSVLLQEGKAVETMEGSHKMSTKKPDIQQSLASSRQSFESARFEAPRSISQSTTASVSVRSVVAGVFLDWPRPPKGAGNASNNNQVHCPYCFDQLDDGEIRRKTNWRKHVKKDLEPYNCFHPQCGTLLKMFPNEGQWAGHIRTYHSPGSWICRMRPHITAMAFSTEDAFREHLECEHEGMYPKSRVSTMAKAAYRSTNDNLFDKCPMECPENQKPPESATELGPLVSHIANHLLSLALESLPERSVRSSEFPDDDETEEGKKPSVAGTRETVRDAWDASDVPALEFSDEVEGAADTDELATSREDRLRFYRHIPLVERQHRPLDAISQLKDDVMANFFKIQRGVSDVSLLLRQFQTRRRWRIIIIAAFVVSSLARKIDAAPGGTVNKSTGSAYHFPGTTFSGPVYFDTEEHFDPLRECLRSLAFPEMDSRSNDIDVAAKGTCEWLLQHKTYTSWVSCDRALLWIKGKPGSGKSTLLRYALNNVMEIPNTGEGALTLSFFFHGRGTTLQKTPLGLFRSLLHQLLRYVPEALTDFVAAFQQRCEIVGKPGEKWQWHPHELQRRFESSLLNVLKTRPLWLFVDALDECGHKNAVNLANEFKSLLERLPSSGLKQFHICFTCRHYPILDLDGVFEVCVEKENWKGISTFVQDKLSSFKKRTSSTIPDLITKRAEGIFLWALLAVKQVLKLDREGIAPQKIEAEIRSIPQQLDDLYRELIRSMGPNDKEGWTPLSQAAWAGNEAVVRLLLEKGAAINAPDKEGRTPLLQAARAGNEDIMRLLLEKGAAIDAPDEEGRTPLSQAAGAGHEAVVWLLLGGGAHTEAADKRGRMPLSWAAENGHEAVVRLLLEKGAAIDAPDKEGRTPVLQAAWAGNEDVMRLLLEKGAAIDAPDKEGRTPVLQAAWAGNEDIMRLLLEKGAAIDAPDEEGRTPLSQAAWRGHEAVARLLLEKGAAINAPDKEGWTPLLQAARAGNESIVRLLLEKGAAIDAPDKERRTPLLQAAWKGHESIMRLLLGGDAHTEAADKRGRTPLWWAAGAGHESIVRLLLEKGAAVDTPDKEGRTLLSRAAWAGHESIVRLLLEKGAAIDAPDKEGRTPVLQAAWAGNEDIMRLLLEKGAAIDAPDEEGRTPLSQAAWRGHEAVARLLLEKGAAINAPDKEGWTPLLQAARAGNESIVRLLLEKGAAIDAPDKERRTPLLQAAWKGHEAVARLLLEKGAAIDTPDKERRTPLLLAAWAGHEDVVRLLLGGGAHTEAADKRGRTPLLWAAENGHESVVRLLQVHAAQPSSTPLS